MTTSNPFRPTRFEFHDRPLIWVSPLINDISGFDSHYLCGTRGSGKTSLLKTMHWSERINNASLRAQLGHDFPNYIGVYIKLTDYMSFSFSKANWSEVYPNSPDVRAVAFHYFSTFIEILAVEQIAEALTVLRQRGKFSFTPNEEKEVVFNFLKRHKFLLNFSDGRKISYLGDLCDAAANMHAEMNAAVIRGSLNEIESSLPRAEGGSLIRDFSKIIQELTSNEGDSIHVKICVDDCESLVDEQRVFLNTIVRKAKFPVAWVLSYVDEQYDTTTTYINDQGLTDADRKVRYIDTFASIEFETFCEQVADLRLSYYEGTRDVNKVNPDDHEVKFSLADLLGSTDVNRLILSSKDKNVGSEFTKLRSRVRAAIRRQKDDGRIIASPSKRRRNRNYGEDAGVGEGEDLPIYQFYVIEKLMASRPAEEIWVKKNTSFDAYLRRKQRAALLCMCSEFGFTTIPYGGKNVVLAMSDNCIRDFLEIMAEIYDAYSKEKGGSALEFRRMRRVIPQNLQVGAIVRASESKFTGILNLTETFKGEAHKLIECLGRLVSKLQSNHRDIEALRTPERGILVFDYPPVRGNIDENLREKLELARSVINRCVLDGLLKHHRSSKPGRRYYLEQEREEYPLRLHRRFAAYFGFSFQGPYNPVRIPLEDIVTICTDPKSVNVDEWVGRVHKKICQWEPGQVEFNFAGRETR